MAYDGIRRELVVFGGANDANQPLGDTWVWGEQGWRNASSSGPAPQSDHAMAFDDRRGVVVLFGSGQTWEWDGQGWTNRTPAQGNPEPRTFHRMAFSDALQQVVMYGGADGLAWTWDGESWSALSLTGAPAARLAPAMAYDAQRNHVVVFSGTPGGNALDPATWTFSESSWLEVESGSFTGEVAQPAPRADHSVAYDPNTGRVLVFGGWLRRSDVVLPQSGVWSWDGTQWFDVTPTAGAFPRVFPLLPSVLAYSSDRGRLTHFDAAGANRVHEWNGTGWEEARVDGTVPPNVTQFAAAYDPVRQTYVMFGGAVVSFGELPRDFMIGTREYVTSPTLTGTWTTPGGTQPSPRYQHGMAYDEARGRMVLFGGRGEGDVPLNETWERIGVNWSRVDVSGPSPSAARPARMVFDRQRGQVVLVLEGTPGPQVWGV